MDNFLQMTLEDFIDLFEGQNRIDYTDGLDTFADHFWSTFSRLGGDNKRFYIVVDNGVLHLAYSNSIVVKDIVASGMLYTALQLCV